MAKLSIHRNKKEDPIVKTYISLPKSFHKKIKQRALDEDTTINALILKALEKYFGK